MYVYIGTYIHTCVHDWLTVYVHHLVHGQTSAATHHHYQHCHRQRPLITLLTHPYTFLGLWKCPTPMTSVRVGWYEDFASMAPPITTPSNNKAAILLHTSTNQLISWPEAHAISQMLCWVRWVELCMVSLRSHQGTSKFTTSNMAKTRRPGSRATHGGRGRGAGSPVGVRRSARLAVGGGCRSPPSAGSELSAGSPQSRLPKKMLMHQKHTHLYLCKHTWLITQGRNLVTTHWSELIWINSSFHEQCKVMNITERGTHTNQLSLGYSKRKYRKTVTC